MTTIGALSGTFIPAPSCLATTNLWRLTLGGGGNRDQLGPPSTSDCLPSGYIPRRASIYSPGICPSGYSVATEIVQTHGGVMTETTQTCCPSVEGITFSAPRNHQEGYICSSAYTTNATVRMTFSSDSSIFPTDLFVKPPGGLNAYGIVVIRQPTDFTSTSTNAPTSTDPSSQPSPTSAQTNPSSASSTSPGGLSPGAKIGIGVGVAAGVLALSLALAIGYIVGQKRKHRINEGDARGDRTPLKYAASPIPPVSKSGDGFEMGNTMRVEADSTGTYELDHTGHPEHELPGSHGRW